MKGSGKDQGEGQSSAPAHQGLLHGVAVASLHQPLSSSQVPHPLTQGHMDDILTGKTEGRGDYCRTHRTAAQFFAGGSKGPGISGGKNGIADAGRPTQIGGGGIDDGICLYFGNVTSE